MFKNLKNTIKDLAYTAVTYAENALSKSSGKEKKKAAIDFLVNKLEIPLMFKPFVIFLLTNFIDKSIEKAVKCMNQIKNED
ncbi:hypothetical protein IKE67_09255 [bacterium]|nr:hypothetical protein [bacterium]